MGSFILILILLLTSSPLALGAQASARSRSRQPLPPGTAGGAASLATSFNDVRRSDWFYQYIEELAAKGLVRGNPDGTYAPESQLLVDEFLAFTLRTLGYDIQNADGYWARYYVEQALALGLIEQGEFVRYDEPITREQIADIVVRSSGGNFSLYRDYRGIFTDINSASKPDSILKAIELGILAGYEDKTFRPKNTATRAEASVMVLRMIDESYRLELYGDIFFNPKTDLDENKVMKKDKSKDFVMKAVSDMHIGISENGKAVISGFMPELPERQLFVYNISFFDKEGTYLSYHSTASLSEEQKLPKYGKYEIETKAISSQIGSIMIRLAIAEGTNLLTDAQEATVVFLIYKNYDVSDEHINESFIADADGVNGIIEYDFNLTKGIWGW